MLTCSFETLPNGRRLRLARLGEGPALLLLHGYPENLQIWSRLAGLLGRDFQVTALDWPGMGESEEWTGGATPFHMAERLVAVMDALRVERADLVAMDMGGQPALVAAARHPERVRRLVVMNSLVWWEEETSWEIRVLRQYGWNRILIRWLPRLVFYRALATFLPRGTRLPAEIRDEFWRSFRRRDVRRFIARMCAGYQALLPRLPEECQKIKCPTLLLWGARDKHFPPRHAERLAQQVLSARRVVIPEAHHWMAWYRAPEVAGAILDFMASA